MKFAIKVYPETIWGPDYQGNFDLLLDQIVALGIDTIITPAFQGSRLFFPENPDEPKVGWNILPLQEKCQERQLGFIPEFPVFNDPDASDRLPQFRPVSLYGKTDIPASWYRPMCPSNEKYRQYRIDLIYKALHTFKPRLISLNFLQYPYLPGIFDFEDAETSLPLFCYCDFCKQQYQAYSGHTNPLENIMDWFLFRSENITLVQILLAEEIERSGLNTSTIVQIPSVASDMPVEYLRRVCGQDLTQWRGLAQIISPHVHVHQFNFAPSDVTNYLAALKLFEEMKMMPEIDLPLIADQESQEAVGQWLGEFQKQNYPVISIFHWGLLAKNEVLQQAIKSFARP